MKFVSGRFKAVTLCVVLCLLAVAGTAQDLDDVTISGQVKDSAGLAVAGATVVAIETVTGLERTITTDEEGRYRLIELKPGVYKVRVTSGGFGPQERTELTTISGQNLQLDFTLAPAGVQAEAVVTVGGDDAPLVDTTRTIVGSTLTEREIEEIPNNGRNPLDLVLTLGGTSEEALSTKDLAEDRGGSPRSTPLEQGNFSISGGAAYSNNITIDGLDNNDDRSARDRFQPSLEAVAEVQVIRNQFSAEYGRASGGRVNLRTRSGTNKFRGRAFMFFRNDNLNANTWYNNANDLPRLPFTQYNPGFTFGGPVTIPGIYDGKNRTFFFLAYEHDNFKDTTLIDTYVPVIANPRFTLPAPNGTGQFCDSNNSPPPPCAAGVGAVSPYSNLYATPNVGHTFTARFDHQLFKGNELTLGWQLGRRTNRRTRGASVTRIEDALQARNVDTDAINITDNQVFGSKTVNQARFQWSVYEPSYQTDSPLDPVVLVSYRNARTNSVQTLTAGNSTASNLQDFSDSRKETRYQFQDSLTHVIGSHTLKFGVDINHVNSEVVSLGDATGTYNFNSVFNYSNNTLSRYRHNFGTATDVTNTYWGIFANDEFKPVSNLTISFGLRYEKETAVEDDNNFGPRLGIAWDPFKKGRDVVRFGAGIFYNRVLLRTVGDFIQNDLGGLQAFDTNTITTVNNARNNVLAQIALDFPNGYPDVDSLRAAVARANCGTATNPVLCGPNTGFLTNTGSTSNPLRSIDPALKIPESYQFNVGYEREIGKGFVFEANYTWNKSVRLWREYNINVPVLPAGYATLTDWLVANPFTFRNVNNNVRTYRFYLGNTNDQQGVATTQNGTTACSTTNTVTCWVNLNSTSTSTTEPNTNASDGLSSNSVGGPIGVALAATRQLRPNPNFDEMERVSSIGKSFYQGLVLELRSRFRSLGGGFGSTFRFAYTLSRLEDDGLNNTTNAQINGDFGSEWARATQDRRHRIAVTGNMDTPWWLGKLRFSPVVRWGSSAPFNLGIGIDRNLNDVSTDRLIYNGDLDDIVWRDPNSALPSDEFLSRFSLQPIGSPGGNLPRNAGRGPQQFIFDLNVTREWRFGDRFRLRPSVEIGNVLNAAVFSYGSEFIDFAAPPGPTASTAQRNAYETFKREFLVPTRTYRARDIRFGVRFDF
jgi:hypothetical protein